MKSLTAQVTVMSIAKVVGESVSVRSFEQFSRCND